MNCSYWGRVQGGDMKSLNYSGIHTFRYRFTDIMLESIAKTENAFASTHCYQCIHYEEWKWLNNQLQTTAGVMEGGGEVETLNYCCWCIVCLSPCSLWCVVASYLKGWMTCLPWIMSAYPWDGACTMWLCHLRIQPLGNYNGEQKCVSCFCHHIRGFCIFL